MPTRAETEDRIERTRQLLAQGLYKHQVKKALMQAYGVSARSCETWITRAKALNVAATGKSKSEHRVDAYAFYEHVKADPNATIKDKLTAQAGIVDLLALNEPATQIVEHAGAIGVHAADMSKIRQEILGRPDITEELRDAATDSAEESNPA